jgi:hypothetical protein
MDPTWEQIQAKLPTLTRREKAEIDRVLLDPGKLDLEASLFREQYDFVADRSNFATGVCSRRAGKSRGVASWLVDGALNEDSGPSLYLTLTRGTAKRIIWPTVKRLNANYQLGFDTNEAELTFYRDGEQRLILGGVDNKSEIEKARGTGWGRVAIDESQAIPDSTLEELITDVLMPSLMDFNGCIRLIGTPSPVPTGFFYDICQSPDWSHHEWTVAQNPYLPLWREMLDKVLKVRGVTVDHPSILREWFGKWVTDQDSLVFKYDPEKNGIDTVPQCPNWQTVLAVDVGFDDSDAVGVLGNRPGETELYLLDEEVIAKESVSELATVVKRMRAKWKPYRMVGDHGGLGKKIFNEISSRFQIWVEPAEKAEKNMAIQLVNDALRTKQLFLPRDSRCAQDALRLEWEVKKNGKKVVSDRFHSDALDMLVYAYRHSRAYREQPIEEKPDAGTTKWQEAKLLQAAIDRDRARTDPSFAEDRAWARVLEQDEW